MRRAAASGGLALGDRRRAHQTCPPRCGGRRSLLRACGASGGSAGSRPPPFAPPATRSAPPAALGAQSALAGSSPSLLRLLPSSPSCWEACWRRSARGAGRDRQRAAPPAPSPARCAMRVNHTRCPVAMQGARRREGAAGARRAAGAALSRWFGGVQNLFCWPTPHPPHRGRTTDTCRRWRGRETRCARQRSLGRCRSGAAACVTPRNSDAGGGVEARASDGGLEWQLQAAGAWAVAGYVGGRRRAHTPAPLARPARSQPRWLATAAEAQQLPPYRDNVRRCCCFCLCCHLCVRRGVAESPPPPACPPTPHPPTLTHTRSQPKWERVAAAKEAALEGGGAARVAKQHEKARAFGSRVSVCVGGSCDPPAPLPSHHSRAS